MKIQMNKKFIENFKKLISKRKFKKAKNIKTDMNMSKEAENISNIKGKKISRRNKQIKLETNKLDEIKSKHEKLNDTKKIYKRNGANKSYFKYTFLQYFDNFFKNKKNISKGYYVLLVAMVLLGGISVYITYKAYNIFSKQDYTTVYSSIDSNEVNDQANSELVNDIDNKKDNDNQINIYTESKTEQEKDKEQKKETPKVSNKTSSTSTVKAAPKVEPLKFVKPLPGNITKPYSVDTVIYSKTLNLWKTHDGLDIAGALGENVKSMERGTVKKIYDDSFYGKVIIIDHGQGYESLYGNLDSKVDVKEKQVVKKSQIIGKVGNTAIGEIKDEPHIHLQLFKDSKSIDPSSKFDE